MRYSESNMFTHTQYWQLSVSTTQSSRSRVVVHCANASSGEAHGEKRRSFCFFGFGETKVHSLGPCVALTTPVCVGAGSHSGLVSVAVGAGSPVGSASPTVGDGDTSPDDDCSSPSLASDPSDAPCSGACVSSGAFVHGVGSSLAPVFSPPVSE